MRILFLAPQPFFVERGTPIAVRAAVEALASLGHQPTLVTFPGGISLPIAGCRHLRSVRLPGLGDVGPGFSFRKLAHDGALFARALGLARGERFDLVHAVEEASFIGLALSRLYRLPYVCDVDSALAQQIVEKRPALKPLEPWLLACEARAWRGSLGVVAVCRALADRVHTLAPETPVATIEDPTLLDDATPLLEVPLASGRGPVVLYVGNLEPYQGIDLLLDAFADVARRLAGVRLVVVGGAAAHVRQYAERVATAGLSSRAEFIGARPLAELAGWLARADVLVSPRVLGQNTAMKVYSYMDSGRPILATRLLTHTQVLDDQTAVLVAPEPRALADGLLRLLADPDLGRRLAGNARERVRREHSREAFREKLARFYDQVARRLRECPQ